MFLIFLVLTAFVAAYFYVKATEELPQILTFTAVAISLLLLLALAPWEFQLLMIVVLLIGTRKYPWPKRNFFG